MPDETRITPKPNGPLVVQGPVKIVTADAAFVAEVKKRSAPIIDEWITAASAKGVEAAKVLAEFHEELKKVAAGK